MQNLILPPLFRRTTHSLAYAVLTFLVLGVLTWNRAFVRLHLGPVFVLEIGFALWASLAFLSQANGLTGYRQALRYPFLFFAWGMLLLALDVIPLFHPALPKSVLLRAAQHSLLFAYPLLWMAAGLWAYQADRKLFRGLSVAVLIVSTLPNWVGLNVTNISVGPLLAIGAAVAMDFALHSNSPRRFRNWLLAGTLTFFSFLPFWIMWVHQMQRTSLLILVLILWITPLLLPRTEHRRKKAMKTTGTLFAIFIAGWLTTVMLSKSENSFIRAFLFSSLFAFQHGEDITDRVNPTFEFPERFRRYCWKTAISDWSASPVIGIGFVPEVPSTLPEGQPNDGASPVIGPHNSYLCVLARTGVIGLVLFALILLQWTRERGRIQGPRMMQMESLLLFFIPFNGAIHAIFNVGFESPHHCMVMWFFTGAGMAGLKRPERSTAPC